MAKAKSVPSNNIHTGTFEELLQLDPQNVICIRVLTKEEQEQEFLEMAPASDFPQ